MAALPSPASADTRQLNPDSSARVSSRTSITYVIQKHVTDPPNYHAIQMPKMVNNHTNYWSKTEVKKDLESFRGWEGSR